MTQPPEGPGGSAAEVARLLRQRLELGEREIVLDRLSREQVLALARQTSRGRSVAPGEGAAPRKAGTPAKTAAPGRPTLATATPATATSHAGARRAAEPVAELPGSYEELRSAALACTRCRLAETRTQVVFSDGVVNARLVVVGEAPGANEDATGLPFVGAAGKYLDLLLRTVGLSRQDTVYICNVLKCRPPGNRNPLPDEITACAPFLEKQLELIRPQALLAVGSFAAQSLTGQEGVAMGKLRGEVHSYRGVPLVCTYHPAALLRNPKWTRAFWDDLQLLRNVIDGA